MTTQAKTTWRTVRLDEGDGLSLIIDHRGITPKKLGGKWSDAGIPALSAKNIKNGQIVSQSDIRYIDQGLYDRWMPKKLERNDILLTSEAPLGEVYFLNVKSDYCLSQRLFALRANPAVLDPRYTYYYLKSSKGQHQLMQRISGTAAQGIRQAELRKVQLFVPSDTQKQKNIAEVLTAFDEKIENNNRIIKAVEEMAQAIFKEWFVNFRYPGYEKAEFVDSELGRIPKGWEVIHFLGRMKIMGGGTPSTTKQEYWGGQIPFFTPKDASVSFFALTTEKHITQEGLSSCNSVLYPTGTVIVTARGTVGKVSMSGVPMAMNQSCYALKDAESLNNRFLFLLTKTLVGGLKKQATGGVFDAITTATFERLSFVLPIKEILSKFNDVVSSIFDESVLAQSENQKLAAMRDLLLPRLMSGEIKV